MYCCFFSSFFSELQFYLRFVDTVVVFCSANLLRFVIKPDLLKVVFSVAYGGGLASKKYEPQHVKNLKIYD